MRENIHLHLVGGTVRDLLLGEAVKDLDFAIGGNAFSFARKFADMADGSFVPLDEKHDTARVVFHRGDLLMDFSGVRGANITEDLAERDFTINAMAIAFNQMINVREVVLIDPLGGAEDLNNQLIRLASGQGIKNDPIRMLRAYRFAATLDFTIQNQTSAIIEDSVSLLNSVSAERVRDELFKILSVGNSSCYLKAMDDVGLLKQIFPEVARMKGMKQNEYHHLDVWEHSMLTLEFFEANPLPNSLKSYSLNIEDYLNYELVKGRSRVSLLKLATLLHDVGKPVTRIVDRDERIRFFDHSLEGAKITVNIGKRLKLANREISSLRKIVEYHMYPLGLSVFPRKPRRLREKRRAMRRFIQKTGDEWLAILLISFADLHATQGQWRRADDLKKLVQLMGEIAHVCFQETRPPLPKLITGTELMKEFDLPTAPIVGKLLKQLEEAQLDGIVKTRDDAIKMVRNVLSRQNKL